MTLLSPIPGNARTAQNECDRLHALAMQWEHTGHALRTVRTDDWMGAAAEYFAVAQHERGRSWLTAADCHARAEAALRDYLDALFEVQRLADRVIEEARGSGDPTLIEAARQSIARWRDQLADTGRRAAATIRSANAELAALRHLTWPPLPAQPAIPTPADAKAVRVVIDRTPPGRTPANIEPPSPFDVRDPSYQRRLTELNNAVLAYWRT